MPSYASAPWAERLLRRSDVFHPSVQPKRVVGLSPAIEDFVAKVIDGWISVLIGTERGWRAFGKDRSRLEVRRLEDSDTPADGALTGRRQSPSKGPLRRRRPGRP